MKIKSFFIILWVGLIWLVLFGPANAREDSIMRISSFEFEHNKPIPIKFTCQGEGVNPPLSIEGIPLGAKSLALIVDDPDALGGIFVHWLVYDIPIISQIEQDSIFGKQGKNSLGKFGYVSPCPPSGTHHYFFKIYALDVMLNLNEGISKEDLENAMQGHILAEAALLGLYKKK